MLESYLVARDRLLKPGGKMFPSRSTLFAAPFQDDALYAEQCARGPETATHGLQADPRARTGRYTKAGFWSQDNFYGIDLSSLRGDAASFYYSQPVVGPVPPHTLLAGPSRCALWAGRRASACLCVCNPATPRDRYGFDFTTMTLPELQRFTMPMRFELGGVVQVHGIALWFDCDFIGSSKTVKLSTAPQDPLTHWYQVRCMLKAPLAVGAGHVLSGELRFEANESRGCARRAGRARCSCPPCACLCVLHVPLNAERAVPALRAAGTIST